MRSLTLAILVVTAALCSFGAQGRPSSSPPVAPWLPDLGDGRYRNPVIYADYSDPDVIRTGNDFYMAASNFNVVPALPILHSRDLVNWTIVGHAGAKFGLVATRPPGSPVSRGVDVDWVRVK
jgi:beta-xylosidase